MATSTPTIAMTFNIVWLGQATLEVKEDTFVVDMCWLPVDTPADAEGCCCPEGTAGLLAGPGDADVVLELPGAGASRAVSGFVAAGRCAAKPPRSPDGIAANGTLIVLEM
jgi:hypothetical protein